jgi:hypothetical protein
MTFERGLITFFLVIWGIGFAYQRVSKRDHLAPKWLCLICLTFDNQSLNFLATLIQVWAYQIVLIPLAINRLFVKEPSLSSLLANLLFISVAIITYFVMKRILRRVL